MQTQEKDAVNSFEKYFFKLMNNSVYGKSMESLREKIKVRLVNNAKDYKKSVSKRSFFSYNIFSKNFVAIQEIKPVLTLDKIIDVGLNILDLSTLLMYEFHYNYNKRKFSANLLFTDTDSLVYEIETNYLYEDFYEDKNLFDFSCYPQDSKFFSSGNNKVIGTMKDELKGKIINEFVGLNSKTYSLIAVDGKEIKIAKGGNKNVVKNKRQKELIKK